MRQQRSLAGTWQFQLDPEGRLSVESLAPDLEIPVPMPWQAAFPHLQQYSGYAWYRVDIDLDESWLLGELLLHFGAVDYWCQVFVNGQLVGEHEGGYTPFDLPVRPYVQAGRNQIAVRVYDAAQDSIVIPRWPDRQRKTESEGPPFDPEDIPHGKQEWYINAGGIWQDVVLTAVPSAYVARIHVTPDSHSGQAYVEVEVGGENPGERAGELRVAIEADGNEVGHTAIPLATGQNVYHTTLKVDRLRLWSPDDPYLYTVTATIIPTPDPRPPTPNDDLSVRFGFREISTRNGQITLNGEPIFLLSALDQDLYPDTIYTVPSDDFLRDQFSKAKRLGLNCLRCHIKPPDPRYLDLADEMGLLIWAEVPSWRTFQIKGALRPEQTYLDESIKRRVEQTLEEMIRRDYNHPSLVIWTLVNEDWGTSLALSADDRAWVGSLYEKCKQLDPTRLVVDNSACLAPWGPNVHVRSDLDDFHIYANIPDQAKNFERTIEQFNLRPLWTYSNHGDTSRTGDEPLVLSEFGNWGLPSLSALRAHHGGDPPWFTMGAWWSPWEGEPGWPEGIEERFDRLGLSSIWSDYEAFATATQQHQFDAMKFEIEAMRRQPALAGYVITEFTDAYWESNGLLDFARNPKVYFDAFASINSPDVIVARPAQYAYWDDQSATVQLYAAHFGPDDWSGATLRWAIGDIGEAGDEGSVEVPDIKRGEVRAITPVTFRLPKVEDTRTIRVAFNLLSAGSQRPLAHNSLELLVLPTRYRSPAYDKPVAIVTRRGAANWGAGDEALKPPALPLGDTTQSDEETAATPELPDESDDVRSAPGLEGLMPRLGYRTARGISADTQVAVATYASVGLLQWVRDGGSLLFISKGLSPFFWVQSRGGSYSGNWITSFSWLRTDVHRRLKVSNPLGLPFMKVMPKATILGLPVENSTYQPDFLAGMVIGWVRHPGIHTVQFGYGRGRVIMTTFAIPEALSQDDPVAVALCHDLLDHLCSGELRPTLTANY